MKSKAGSIYLPVTVSVFCACCCVLFAADSYSQAQFKLNTCKQELQGWEACRVARPAFYRENISTVSNCLDYLNQARENFWVKLARIQLLTLYGLIGITSATCGYIAAYTLAWFGSTTMHKIHRTFKRNK